MFIRRSRVCLAVVASAVLFAACEDSSNAPDPAAPGTAAKPARPAADPLQAEMVAAVPANRSGNAVSMHFVLGARPEVHKALPVEIAIVPRQEFESVSAHFLSQDGLAVSVGESFGPMSSPAVGKALKHQLVLMPGREGVFVITASIETSETAGNLTRLFSIPVVVSPVGSAEVAGEATTAQPQSQDQPATN